MRENATTESGQFAENTSSGGIKFHLKLKPERAAAGARHVHLQYQDF
jgi:hypothetical protein